MVATKTKKRTARPATKGQSKADRRWPIDGSATYPEAAAFLQVHRTTVWRLVTAKMLTAVPVGKRGKRIAWAVLHAYAEGQDTAKSA